MKLLILIISSLVYLNILSAQSIGSKVSLPGVDGKTYIGVITQIQGNQYKVKYDGYNFDAWLTRQQFTVLSQNAALPNTKVNKYGTRDPRTCDDKKAPAKGAITAALAAKYFICKAEGISGQKLNLIENLKLEVGGGIPFHAVRNRAFDQIDVSSPVYPIRGSYTLYLCNPVDPNYTWTMAGKNSTRIEHRNATGYCYKTTFGDWSCYMIDLNQKDEDWQANVPPPKY